MSENENIINEKILITILHENCFYILEYYFQLNETCIPNSSINNFLRHVLKNVSVLFFLNDALKEQKN